MQCGFSSVVLRGRSKFAESEFDDVATSLIPAFNLLIYFFRTGGGASHQHGWISIGWRTFLAILVHAMAQSRPSNHLRFNRTAWRASGRTPRSRHDQAAIRELQWRNCLQTIGRRSTSDQDDDCGPIVLKIVAFSKGNSSLFAADLKPQIHAIETASTTLENRPHECVNCPRSSGQFSL